MGVYQILFKLILPGKKPNGVTVLPDQYPGKSFATKQDLRKDILMNSLSGFPLPTAEKKRWPLESPEKDDGLAPKLNWPKMSIITPSFNQGHFIEETIRSVILQNYPNLEFIIIDGGSTDDTISIIRRYEKWVSYWVSEPDRGQSQAINRGLALATGEWVAWLNADDVYLPGAFFTVANTASNKNESITWIVGTTIHTNSELIETGRFVPSLYTAPGRDSHYKQSGWIDFVCTKRSGIALPQASSFWKRSIIIEAGGIDESLNYAMDHELYGRLAYHGYHPILLEDALACFRKQPEQKSANYPLVFWEEELKIVYNWVGRVDGVEKEKLQHYGTLLRKRIKWQPFTNFLQSLLAPLKKCLKRLSRWLYK
jgi:glycosyltransferase involved in cell wall biosynthesis